MRLTTTGRVPHSLRPTPDPAAPRPRRRHISAPPTQWSHPGGPLGPRRARAPPVRVTIPPPRRAWRRARARLRRARRPRSAGRGPSTPPAVRRGDGAGGLVVRQRLGLVAQPARAPRAEVEAVAQGAALARLALHLAEREAARAVGARRGAAEEAADVARELRREARELLERAGLVLDRARIARGVDALGREQPARAAERVVAELVLEAARAHRRAARLRVVPAALGVGARREPVDEELRALTRTARAARSPRARAVALPVEREPLELGDALVQHALREAAHGRSPSASGAAAAASPS